MKASDVDQLESGSGHQSAAVEPVPGPTPEPVLPEPAPAQVRLRHRVDARLREAGCYIKDLFGWPDLVTQRPASLVERLRYARHGDYTPPGGFLRGFKLGYTYLVSIPVAAVAAAVSWWFERPARAGLLLVTGFALWLTPPGQTIAAVLAWAARTWAGFLTF